MYDRWIAGAGFLAAALVVSVPAGAGWLSAVFDQNANKPIILAQAGDAERFNRIESQMRMLTGQVEELEYRLRQLQELLSQIQADSDFRFQDLEGGGVVTLGTQPQQSDEPVPLPTPPANAQQLGRVVAPAPTTAPAVGGGAEPLDLSALARNAGSEPLEGAASNGGGQVALLQTTGDPVRDYQQGYTLVLAGNYAGAEATFRQFLNTYPGHARAPDAQFWIGESYFARGQYREAADEFLAGYKSFPNSQKGPDTLLKLGLSLAGLGEREAACSTYAAVLKQYPDTSNALRQRVVSEQAVADC